MASVSAPWVAQQRYDSDICTGAPVAMSLVSVTSCSSSRCTSVQVNNVTQFMNLECNITDRFTYAENVYGEFNYIVAEDYADTGCENLRLTTVLPASGTCSDLTMYGRFSMVSVLFANGSALIRLYDDVACDGDASMNFALDSGDIESGDCVQDHFKFYTSASGSVIGLDSGSLVTDSGSGAQGSNSPSGLNGFVIVGIILAAGAVGFMMAVFFWKRRSPGEHKTQKSDSSVSYDSYAALQQRPKSVFSTGTKSSYSKDSRNQRSISYYWDDDEIAAARVDRDKIDFEGVISHGGYGQVMSGWFNGQHVAVKMLLSEYRKSMKHLTSFLEEVKRMAMLEHPRIVEFVGVAWDSLADLCVLTEFMEGGNLRTLLNSYEAQHVPVGFNEAKVTIALHVAHALTYLHSLDPPVLHRDLKSKNILLSANHDAKLTDFGISREHIDHTMTAGVGTSRWMAPEVMMGENYDDKADVFSMGVVLSELDLHALPYSHAKDESNPSRKIPSTAIVHLVAMGKLQIEFSSASPIAQLGLSCVQVNPEDRPTAAEELYKLHTILTTEYDRGGWGD